MKDQSDSYYVNLTEQYNQEKNELLPLIDRVLSSGIFLEKKLTS